MLLTDAFYLQLYFWAHYLVPTIDAPYEPSRAIEASGPTEGMGERCSGCEVMLDGCALLLWLALT